MFKVAEQMSHLLERLQIYISFLLSIIVLESEIKVSKFNLLLQNLGKKTFTNFCFSSGIE